MMPEPSSSTSWIIVEEAERLEDLVLRVAVQNFLRHHRHELWELDRAGAVIIDVLDHLLDLLFLWLEAECTHCNLELLRINGSRTICVKQIEGFLDLLLLLLCELLLLLTTGVETTESHLERNLAAEQLQSLASSRTAVHL